MAANMYDLPALAKFINTYAPINFDLLYRVGLAQKQEVDKAVQDLSGNLLKWSEFHSQSAKDTESYHNLTVGKMAPIINELAANPDMLKTAEGRSRLQSAVNNIDYKSLGILKLSKEGFTLRLAAVLKLALEGKMDPRWHSMDYANYNSLDPSKGVFNDTAPLAYKSEVDLVKPFVDNLKAGWIGNKGGWEYSGVTAQRTDQEIQKNISSILNTPEYAKHLEVLQRQGYSPEEAEERLNTTLVTAGREFAYETREVDPWAMENMRLLAKAAGEAKETGELKNLTTLVQRDSAKTILTNFSGIGGERARQLMSGAKPTAEEQERLSYTLNPEVMKSRLNLEFSAVSNNKKNVNAGANHVLDMVSSQLSPEATDIYSKIGANEKISSNTYRANDSSNFQIADNLAYSLMGTTRAKVTNPTGAKNIPAGSRMNTVRDIIVRNKFENQWNNGDFTDFIIKGENKAVTSLDGNSTHLLKYAYIPIEQLSGYTEAQLKHIGGSIATLKSDYFSQGASFDEEGNPLKTNTTAKPALKYLKIKVTNQIPVEGEAATAADNVYSKKTMGIGANPLFRQVELSQQERIN